jgi:hypothetical protein
MKWLEKKSNQVVYKFYSNKTLLDNKYKSFASQEASISFLEEIKLIKKNKVKMRCRHWLKYAAVFLLRYLGLVIFYESK